MTFRIVERRIVFEGVGSLERAKRIKASEESMMDLNEAQLVIEEED